MMIAVARPIIDACRGLAKVAAVGLWNEIGDALGLSVDNEHGVPHRRDVVHVLDRAVRSPSAQWRARCVMRIVDHEVLGPVFVKQKGGCCLAYLSQLPDGSNEQRYCSTRSVLDWDECARCQLSGLG